MVGHREVKLGRPWCEVDVMFHIVTAKLYDAYGKNTILARLVV